MNRVDLKINNYRETPKQQYGFVADKTKPLAHNIETALGSMTMREIRAQPKT